MTARGAGAVFAGLVLIFSLSIAIDVVLHSTGIFPRLGEPMSDGLFAVAFAYRTLIGVAGGYLTARLAPAKPLDHAIALGAVGILLSIAGAAATWNAGPAFGPKWYPLALVAMSLPSAWVGGKLFTK